MTARMCDDRQRLFAKMVSREPQETPVRSAGILFHIFYLRLGVQPTA